jgi:hypothetical protein
VSPAFQLGTNRALYGVPSAEQTRLPRGRAVLSHARLVSILTRTENDWKGNIAVEDYSRTFAYVPTFSSAASTSEMSTTLYLLKIDRVL